MSPARDYPLQRAPVTIQYSLMYEMHSARQAAGLTIVEFDLMPGTPLWVNENHSWSKSHVIAWHRNHMLIPAIQNDAMSREAERKRRMGMYR